MEKVVIAAGGLSTGLYLLKEKMKCISDISTHTFLIYLVFHGLSLRLDKRSCGYEFAYCYPAHTEL